MKTIFLLLTLLCGILFPQGHIFSFLIKYILMGLLLFAFLDIHIDRTTIQRSHYYILTANLILPLILFYTFRNYNFQLAQASFVTALAPTAIAAPVVISILNRKVEYVIFSLLITNIVIALIIPFLFANLMNSTSSIEISSVLFPVIYVFLIPFILAQTIKKFLPSIFRWLNKIKDESFYLLMIAIYLGTSNASNFIRTEMTQSFDIVIYIGICSLIICLINFNLGSFIAGKKFAVEGGQSLGQKNNAFTIWLAITFLNPLSVIGPVFYVLFQNIYISWQLYRYNRKRLQASNNWQTD